MSCYDQNELVIGWLYQPVLPLVYHATRRGKAVKLM